MMTTFSWQVISLSFLSLSLEPLYSVLPFLNNLALSDGHPLPFFDIPNEGNVPNRHLLWPGHMVNRFGTMLCLAKDSLQVIRAG